MTHLWYGIITYYSPKRPGGQKDRFTVPDPQANFAEYMKKFPKADGATKIEWVETTPDYAKEIGPARWVEFNPDGTVKARFPDDDEAQKGGGNWTAEAHEDYLRVHPAPAATPAHVSAPAAPVAK